MFKSYLKIAIRNLRKNKAFSAINILGLAIGLCCFILIALYVLNEVSYDKMYPKAERIFRVNSDLKMGDYELHIAQSSDKMGEVLKADYPIIEDFTRIYNNAGSKLIKKGDLFLTEKDVVYVDSNFFRFFPRELLDGQLQNALNSPAKVAISESAAIRFFGNTKAAGKVIQTNDKTHKFYTVMAVYKDFPENSHLKADFLFSMQSLNYPWGTFLSHNFYTYLLLKPGADYTQLESKFPEYLEKYCLPEAREYMSIESGDEFARSGNRLEYSLIPVPKIHLFSTFNYEMKPAGNIQYVYIFSAIAIFILLIACINFMNLATARSARRAKEVGIRKVLGTQRKNLIFQFITETIVLVLISESIAIVLSVLLLPFFSSISGVTFSTANIFNSYSIPFFLLMPIIVGLIAGGYPAFYLSWFNPIEVLRSSLITGKGNRSLRSSLVVFQFATAIMLIIGTIVIYRQLNFIQNVNLGYNKEQVLIINGSSALANNTMAFKQEMLAVPGVKSATFSSFLPVSNSSRSDYTYSKDPVVNSSNSFSMQTWDVDEDYIPTMGMELLKGRNFSRDFGTDSNTVIINEATAKYLNYEDPLGKKIYYTFDDYQVYTIIGVIKNFNYESLRSKVSPLALFLRKNTGLMSLRIDAAQTAQILSAVENRWKSMAPEMPFSYRFMNDSFDQMYASERRVSQIAIIFSILAIFIASLGLVGLSAFTIEQKAKEISIRKVLGASVRNILQLVSRDFLLLVFIAFLIASPLAWLAMNKWLHEFAYRIDLSVWFFIYAGVLALIISLLTIIFQAFRAAHADPVKNLRRGS